MRGSIRALEAQVAAGRAAVESAETAQRCSLDPLSCKQWCQCGTIAVIKMPHQLEKLYRICDVLLDATQRCCGLPKSQVEEVPGWLMLHFWLHGMM